MKVIDAPVPRKFVATGENGKIRLISYREDLLIDVADERAALEAFSASPFVTADGAKGPNSDDEVEQLFNRQVESWERGLPSAHVVVEHRGVAARSLGEALNRLVSIPRDIRDYNAAMFRVFGPHPVRIVVSESAAFERDASESGLTLPVVLSGGGVVVGPFLHDRSPCYRCIKGGLAMQGFHFADPVEVRADALLAARVVDSLFTRPFVPYADDCLVFARGLDDAPHIYQALRIPKCESCDPNYGRFPKRYNRHEVARSRGVLKRRGLLS